MSEKQKAKLRAIPSDELERRMERLKHGRMFWRYYFELAIRKMEAGA